MAVDVAYLKSKVDKNDYSKSEKFENQAYYATENPEPEKRLVDILQESCFWSQHLYQSCQKRAVAFSVFISILIIVLVITGLTLIGSDSNYSVPRLSLLFLTFFPLWSSVRDVEVTLSIGIVSSHTATYEDLYKSADQMLYEAKNRGRNQFVSALI